MSNQSVAEKNSKKAEDTNQQQMAEFHAQLAAVDQAFAVIEFETDGTIITANDNFLATLGYTLPEIQGQHHRLFVEEEYARSPEYAQFWQQLGRGQSQHGEFKRVDRNGNDVWILARYSALLDDDGNVYKVVKYATNITEEVKSRLTASRKRKVAGRNQSVTGSYRIPGRRHDPDRQPELPQYFGLHIA